MCCSYEHPHAWMSPLSQVVFVIWSPKSTWDDHLRAGLQCWSPGCSQLCIFSWLDKNLTQACSGLAVGGSAHSSLFILRLLLRTPSDILLTMAELSEKSCRWHRLRVEVVERAPFPEGRPSCKLPHLTHSHSSSHTVVGQNGSWWSKQLSFGPLHLPLLPAMAGWCRKHQRSQKHGAPGGLQERRGPMQQVDDDIIHLDARTKGKLQQIQQRARGG